MLRCAEHGSGVDTGVHFHDRRSAVGIAVQQGSLDGRGSRASAVAARHAR